MQGRIALICGGIAALLAASLAQAQTGDGTRASWRERIAALRAQRGDNAQNTIPGEDLAYGRDPLQVLTVWRAKGVTGPAPLVVFVHGGGWKRGSKDAATGTWKPQHYPQQGYVFASINYRLVPANTVEDEASDVAHALKSLLDHAAQYGIDPRRVVLMGHSAGAHLVALVGTDESYLKSAGLSFRDVSGVIPIDGAAYDVPRQIAEGGNFMHDTYIQAFGSDPARQKALSPTFHAAAPNAPAFLLIHVQRKDGVVQNEELEAALKKAGTPTQRRDFPGTGLRGHAEINRDLGNPDYAATPVVDAWLKGVFAR